MADVVFDTLGLARRLRDRAGFTPEHAEETAQAIAETMGGQVVTKADFAGLRADFADLRADFADLRADFAELRNGTKLDLAELRGEFTELRDSLRIDRAELKSELTRLMLTVATGQVALLLAAMFSLARLGR